MGKTTRKHNTGGLIVNAKLAGLVGSQTGEQSRDDTSEGFNGGQLSKTKSTTKDGGLCSSSNEVALEKGAPDCVKGKNKFHTEGGIEIGGQRSSSVDANTRGGLLSSATPVDGVAAPEGQGVLLNPATPIVDGSAAPVARTEGLHTRDASMKNRESMGWNITPLRPFVSLFAENRNLKKAEKLSFHEDVQKGRLKIREEDIAMKKVEWGATLIGVIPGQPIPFHVVQRFVASEWKTDPPQMFLKDNGVFVFKFKSECAVDWVLSNGPWAIYGSRSLILKCWTPGIPITWTAFERIPVWVCLPDLDPVYYTNMVLSRLGCTIGNPICIDDRTASGVRLSYARMLVEVTAEEAMISSIDIEDTNCKLHKQKVNFEWLPMICKLCKKFGHAEERCVMAKNVQGNAMKKVWVQKTQQEEGYGKEGGKQQKVTMGAGAVSVFGESHLPCTAANVVAALGSIGEGVNLHNERTIGSKNHEGAASFTVRSSDKGSGARTTMRDSNSAAVLVGGVPGNMQDVISKEGLFSAVNTQQEEVLSTMVSKNGLKDGGKGGSKTARNTSEPEKGVESVTVPCGLSAAECGKNAKCMTATGSIMTAKGIQGMTAKSAPVAAAGVVAGRGERRRQQDKVIKMKVKEYVQQGATTDDEYDEPPNGECRGKNRTKAPEVNDECNPTTTRNGMTANIQVPLQNDERLKGDCNTYTERMSRGCGIERVQERRNNVELVTPSHQMSHMHLACDMKTQRSISAKNTKLSRKAARVARNAIFALQKYDDDEDICELFDGGGIEEET